MVVCWCWFVFAGVIVGWVDTTWTLLLVGCLLSVDCLLLVGLFAINSVDLDDSLVVCLIVLRGVVVRSDIGFGCTGCLWFAISLGCGGCLMLF